MKKSRIKVQTLITYSRIFPDANQESISNLLKDIPTLKALEICSFLLFRADNSVFWQFLLNTSNDFKHSVINFLSNENDFILFDKYTILCLIEKLLENNNKKKQNFCKELEYTNFLKAYLICCDERIQLDNFVDNSYIGTSNYIDILLPQQIRYCSVYYPKDFRTEYFKLFTFNKFISHNEQFREYMNIFLEEYKLKDLDAYFNIILKIYDNALNNKTLCLKVDSNNYIYNFISGLCIDLDSYKSSKDFISLRDKPIIQIDNEHFIILYINFFLDKLFNGFLFDLVNVLKRKKIDISYQKIKQKLGQDFIEHFLFYDVLNYCFNSKNTIKYTGTVLKKHMINAEPDYYIREKNRIYLFEFKDVILNAESKDLNNSIESLIFDLKELFVEATIERSTGKLKKKPIAKGAKQLLNVIENKLPSFNENIDVIDSNIIYVFPIIVYHDNVFDAEGVNFIINNKFNDLLSKKNIDSRYVIKNLIMIPLNLLIELEDFFNERKIQLGTCINAYIAQLNNSTKDELLPFRKFLYAYACKKGYKTQTTKRFKSIINTVVNRNINIE